MKKTDFIDLKQFEKKKKIGKGSFGKVYIVQMKSSNKIYAAKVSINEIDEASSKEMLNISREVNIISKLEHATILKFIGYSPTDFDERSKPVIITEFSPNGSLREVLKLEKKKQIIPGWDNTKKMIVIFGIANGMAYLHSHNIIHRDLKPDNIFLDDYLCPKIADFGLSKIEHSILSNAGSIKSTTGIKGTPIYMSPEIWEKHEYTAACDVYAYSLIVYEIITGITPFKDYNIIQILSEIVHKGTRPTFDESVPLPFQNLLSLCWSKDPKDRPSFSTIVEQIKTNPDFIIKGADKDDFLTYVTFLENSEKAYNSTRRIIHLSDIIKPTNKTYQKVMFNRDESIISIIDTKEGNEEDPELELKFLSRNEFNTLDKSCRSYIFKAEKTDDNDTILLIANSFLNGSNNFPKNITIGKKYLEYAVSKSHFESLEVYSTLLLEGKIYPKDEEKAIQILNELVEKSGSITAKYKIAINILSHVSYDINESNEDVNYILAKKYLKEASENGLVVAMLPYSRLCMCKKKNRYGEITCEPYEVLKYCKLSADNNDPEGIAFYGRLLENGYVNLKPNPIEAVRHYQKAYEKGSMTGCALLGHALIKGSGNIEKKEKEGLKLVEISLSNRNPFSAALSYTLNKDPHQVKTLMKLATDLGDYMAFRNVGINYIEGNIVEKNFELGMKYLKRAIEEGCYQSAFVIGNIFRKGIPELGIEPNEIEALKYLKYAADNGSFVALFNYPYELTTLTNAEHYKDEIEKYFKIGVEMDYYEVMTYYGAFLIAGKYFPQNIEEGKKLMKRAADSGNAMSMLAYSKLPENVIDRKEAFFYGQMAEKKNNGNDKCIIQ